MTTTQTMTLKQANATAYQVSRALQKTMEVRQVSASGFTYCERGATEKGQLVGAFKNGQAVA